MKPLSDLQADWPAINRLLDEALELPPAERSAWLAALPAEPAGLKDTVARLLAATGGVETGDFLHTLPKLGSTGQAAAATGAQVGAEVGPWRLLREIGEGGMGSVWLAERADGSLKRQVALKLPRLSWQRGLAERMARERDILATLEHPHIARLYDAGVDALGRPWLALEYVQGRTIDEHARSQGLDVKQRVQLLLQVCEAVAYAHSRLAIHRDLKPGNILVTEDGRVKLLDFGIAKLMQGEQAQATALTELGGRALTLDYASPEQVRGEPLTTASDVYSLGVVAYELLTGAKPYRLKRGSQAELEEAIASVEPVRASDAAADAAARKVLKGDLDAILNMALKKAAAQRYATVDALAQDLRRYLAQEPVLARPDSLLYRVRKLVVRRRLESAIAAGMLIALVGGAYGQFAVATALAAGAGVGTWQYRRARAAAALAAQERDHARQQAARAEAARDFMLDLFTASASREASDVRQLTAEQLLQRGVERIDQLAQTGPDTQAFLLGAFSHVYATLQRDEQAIALQRRSLEAATRAHGPDAPQTLAAMSSLADRLWRVRRVDECSRLVDEALRRLERVAPQSLDHLCVLVDHMRIWVSQDPQRAVTSGLQALAFVDRVKPQGSEAGQVPLYLARACKNLGRLHDSMRYATLAREKFDALLGAGNADSGFALQQLAWAQIGLGQFAEAVRSAQASIEVFSSFPELCDSSVPGNRVLLARALRASGQRASADEQLALALVERRGPPTRYPSAQLIRYEQAAGQMLAGDDAEAAAGLDGLLDDPDSDQEVVLGAAARRAVLHACAGDIESATQRLEQARKLLLSHAVLIRILNVEDAAAQVEALAGHPEGVEAAVQRLRDALPAQIEGVAVAAEVDMIEARAWMLLNERRRAQTLLLRWQPALLGGAAGIAEPLAAEMLVFLAESEPDAAGARSLLAAAEPLLSRTQVEASPLRQRAGCVMGQVALARAAG